MIDYAYRDRRYILHRGWLSRVLDWLTRVPQWDPDPGMPLPSDEQHNQPARTPVFNKRG